MRDSFVFYRSFYTAIKRLSAEDQANALRAIAEYALDEKEPESEGIERTVFELVKPQIDANNKRYLNGTKGGRPKTKKEPNNNQTITKPEPSDNQTITKKEPNHNQAVTKPEPNVNVNVNVNDNDNEKICNTVTKTKRFVPPTLEDVIGYCQETGRKMDAERFIDFYSSKGWMVGKNKMKDWKAAVRNWTKQDRDGQIVKPKPTGFNNFEQRDTNYDELVTDQVMAWIKEG